MFKTKWTKELIVDFILKRDYIFIEFIEYNGVNSIIKIKCKNENHKPYIINFNGFKNGSNCKECKYENIRKKFSFSYNEVKECFAKEGYILLSDTYINANSPLLVKCPNGHISEITLGNFKSNHRCSCCMGNKKHTLDYVKEFVKPYNYKVISEKYLGSSEPLTLECDKAHIYTACFSSFQQGVRCPYCNLSKGETKIKEVLNSMFVKYEIQKSFNGLIGCGGGMLSYDFYIPEHNLLIEYQGEYHDGSVSNQTERAFLKQKEHDRRKLEFAYNNNIELLEIWYYDFDNIEEILKEKFNK